MTDPTADSHPPAGDGADPTRGQEVEPVRPEDGEAREEPSAKGAPDEPEEEKLSAEEERAARDEIRTVRTIGLGSLLPGLAFRGATSLGGYAAGRDINVHVGAAVRAPVIGRVPADELAALRAFHVPFHGYDKAGQVLATRHVLVLRGAADSGRRTSALALLTSLVGDNVRYLGQDREVEALFAGDVDDECGYLLHSVPGPEVGKLIQPKLSGLEYTLKESRSFLVITLSAGGEQRPGDLDRYLVDHSLPDPCQVLHSHLRRQYAEFPDLLADWLADSRLDEQVKVVEKPRAVAELAARMAEAMAQGSSLDDVLDRVRGGARLEARRLLHSTDQEDPELRPIEQLQRCAFLVALAVFNDAPYLAVAAAAESLTQLFIKVAYPLTPQRKIFALRREHCLDWLRGTVEPRRRSNRQGEQSVEHIRLCNPDLPSALLVELWREYDAARSPVLRWLQDLANGRHAELRVRAAQAVGTLATDDFEYVYREVISEWAGSRWATQRESAAWALEAAVVIGGTGDRVRRLLRDWCRTGSRNRQLAAVTAYGTRIGADRPVEALRSLRYLTRSEDPEMTRIACNSVVELFVEGKHDMVLDRLREWLDDTDGTARRLAVAAFVQITYLPDDTGRPLLLLMCAGNHPKAGFLERLWRHALSDDYARADTWEALWQWCQDAERHPDLLAPFQHLITALESADDDLRTRLTWYRDFWAAHPNTPSAAGRIQLAGRKE